MGELDIYKNPSFITTNKIGLNFNQKAVQAGGSLKIRYAASPKNPYLLNNNNLIINNSKDKSINVSPSDKELTFKIAVDKKLAAGKYEGKLYFESADIVI